MKKMVKVCICLFLFLFLLSGCGRKEIEVEKDHNKIKIVATDFAPYDFAKNVAGEGGDVTMLLSPGEEAHSFEPTPKEVIEIQNCDVFVYTGGESEEWVTDILKDLDRDIRVVKLMDCVDLYEEETIEGMEVNEHGHEHEEEHGQEERAEYDEHVWTAPENAIKITRYLCEAYQEADPAHADIYEENADFYTKKLKKLDQAFWDIVTHAKRKTLVFGDRFPVRYFVEEYGLDYYAAFPGCASNTEASAKTVAFLIDKVKKEQIPIVFHVELSNEDMADTICEDTGAKKRQFSACHNISKEQFEKGVGYLDLMWDNVKVLKEALN